MRDYIITVNSTVDTGKEWLEERNVPVIPLKYTIDGQEYTDMYGLSDKEFFQKLREGKMSVTSQINPEEAKEMLEPYVKEGKDVLHLAFSSALSGTCNSMKIAAEELQEEYPEAKVIVVDTLCACMGEAMLLYYALKQKEAGKTIEEVAQWAEENKLHVCHNVTVDDLFHLHRGGRVSKTAAVLGTMVKVKPIIYGGGQQKGMRSGTENVPGVAALGEAAAEIYENFDAKIGHMYEIKQRFIDEVTQIPGVTVNGKTGRDSAPQIVSVTIEDVRSEVMLHSLEEYGIYVSAGSACSSNKPAPSRTLQGIGLPKQKLESTIRISFCVNTTEEEVDYAVEKMKEIIPFRRKFTRK